MCFIEGKKIFKIYFLVYISGSWDRNGCLRIVIGRLEKVNLWWEDVRD